MAWGSQKAWKGRNKYGARKTKCGAGHNHPSALEASVCDMLHLRQRAGEIKNLATQRRVKLQTKIYWCVDFQYTLVETGEVEYVESKGVEGERYRILKQLWKNGAGPGRLYVYKGDYRRPKLVETVIPLGYGGGLHQIDPSMGD